MEKEYKWQQIEVIEKKDREEILKSICVMNLKKSPGTTATVNDELDQVAKEDKTYLNSQFNLYDPDIIICCSRVVSDLFHELIEFPEKPDWKMTSRGVWYHSYKPGKFVISYLHPQAHVPGNMLYYTLLDAVKEIREGY
ncbi:MAG: hypothetical protein D8M58_17205 [Calditrichaeota bacterium]|nr:MAG: hypothetical protein DWQ03_12335 [Calditrichota bacterium]MBL1207146.1 hypothetical protein [Calditrichota bacterium]NOG46976.1 hypothetical protein [Calditrichota bacterium]